MSDFQEVMLSIAILVVFASVFGIAAYVYSKESCEQKSISFKGHKFGIFSGCMVIHQGKWLPLENIRGFDDK